MLEGVVLLVLIYVFEDKFGLFGVVYRAKQNNKGVALG